MQRSHLKHISWLLFTISIFHTCRTCRRRPLTDAWLRKTPVVSSNRSGFKKEETPLAFVKGFHKLSDVLDTLCSYIIVVMLGAMVVITGAQIVCRMAFTALSWSEEATRYLLVWSSFLGASCVYKHSGHISITFVQDMVPAALSKVLKLLVHVVCTILFVVVIIYGMKYFGKQGNQLSAAMRLPMKYIYLCIPVGCGFMLVHAVDAVLGLLFGKEEA